MEARWKGLIIGYVVSVVIDCSFFTFMVFFYEMSPMDTIIISLIFSLTPFFPHLIIMPIGYYIGLKIDSIGKKNLGQQQLDEIRILFREHKSLTEIKGKIQMWKTEGYDVSELEEMLEEAK